MNDIQRISQSILAEQLKLQMGLPLETDLDYRALRAMDRQLRHERRKNRPFFRFSGGLKIQVLDDTPGGFPGVGDRGHH
jgi:hypothetical protein